MRLLEVTVDLDGSSRDDRGRLLARCRIPFAFDATMGLRRILPGGEAARAVGADGKPAEGRGDGVEEVIEGPASSTSIDWYGTRMGRTALESMGRQFVSGVDYFPRHHSWTKTIEWDEIIGRTISATIKSEAVKDAKEGSEQLVLYVGTRLDMREELATKLVERIERGQRIGQSIGGWFTQIAVTYDEEGWATDVEILDVELDHLAAVRSPACPDADRLWLATSRALVEAGGETKARTELRGKASEVEVETRGRTVVARCKGTAAEPTVGAADEEEGRAATRSVDAGAQPPAATREAAPVVPDATTTSEGEGAPSPPARSEPAQEASMPFTKEEMEQFAGLIGGAVGQAVNAAFTARDTKPATPAVPEKSPLELANERADRAEAEARSLRARQDTDATIGASRSGQRTAEQPTAATPGSKDGDVINGLRGQVDGPNGVDLRKVCPKAIRAIRRSYGEVALNPGLILATDGIRGLVSYVEAEGRCTALAEICRTRPALLNERDGLKGAKELAYRYSPAGQEKAQRTDETGSESAGWHEREDLRDLLSDVFTAALDEAPEYFRG